MTQTEACLMQKERMCRRAGKKILQGIQTEF